MASDSSKRKHIPRESENPRSAKPNKSFLEEKCRFINNLIKIFLKFKKLTI